MVRWRIPDNSYGGSKWTYPQKKNQHPLLLPWHEGTPSKNKWQERPRNYKKRQKKTTHWWNLGYDRNQHHCRRISTLQKGPILGPQTTMDKYSPLKRLWGPESSNQISSSNKNENAPPERPIEVHTTNGDLYKKIEHPTTPTVTITIVCKTTLTTWDKKTLGNRQPAHVIQKGS